MALKFAWRGGARTSRTIASTLRTAAPRDGRFIERVGSYNPMLPADHEDRIIIKADRVQYWMDKGAKPTDRVAVLLGRAGVTEMPEHRAMTRKTK